MIAHVIIIIIIIIIVIIISDFITLIMSSEAAWKQDLCNCCGDCEACEYFSTLYS